MIRQLLYQSMSSVPGDGADLAGILEQSRHNNAIDGITGLLWSDGARFLQVIEGPPASVDACWARIRHDSRHHDLAVLLDGPIAAPEFGYWTMAHRRSGEPADVYSALMRRLLATVSPPIKAAFLAMIAPDDGAA